MATHLALALLLFLSLPFRALCEAASASNTYDYIVVGSGPGGGPLAANLAKAGASVLLLEAGEDQGSNLNEEVAGWLFLAFNDPVMRWDFFVKHHTDEAITKKYQHLTWKTTDGQFYVGTDPPPGAEMLGVYYPRAGTLGGCSTHNAMAAALPSDSDWKYIADLTGDKSWSPSNMRKYLVKLENYHAKSVPKGTPGHGYNGYLDITVNSDELLKNQTGGQVVLKEVARHTGQNPNKLFEHIQRDLNDANPNRDQETGIFGFPAHRDLKGRRVSARNPVVAVDSSPKYKLTVKTTSFVTKVLFDTTGPKKYRPDAIGVEYLFGKSMYAADPRYNASVKGTTLRAYARKEVIISGGAFNSPQILKLSGIGPKKELQKFKIPVLVDLPGVGANLQDNQEIGVIANAAQDFVNIAPTCTFGAPGDPCLAAWYEGKGPYAVGPLDAILLKSKGAKERDLFLWGTPGTYRGYWPAQTVNVVPQDPPSAYGFSIIKMHPQSHGGTVLLKSSNPRDVPDINFRFFEGTGDADLQAMSDAVDFGRGVLKSVDAPWAPFSETLPCDASQKCNVKETIREQAWSHHATSTCAIGRDGDPLAVLDSRFRVRGTSGLRVVDGSAFPRTPGAFPVLPTFMLSEKATEVILADSWN